MRALVTQKSAKPTTKVTWNSGAVMVTGALVAIADNYYEILHEPEVKLAVLTVVPAIVGGVVGYFKRERADAS